jgi:hypothetical protein
MGERSLKKILRQDPKTKTGMSLPCFRSFEFWNIRPQLLIDIFQRSRWIRRWKNRKRQASRLSMSNLLLDLRRTHHALAQHRGMDPEDAMSHISNRDVDAPQT